MMCMSAQAQVLKRQFDKIESIVWSMVDIHCPDQLKDNFSLFAHEGNLFSCALNQADVVNNCNKSYIMQLFNRADEIFITYSRFGRVGQVGSMSTDIHVDRDDAIAHFKKTFREKTGVRWEDRYVDTDIHPGKYQFILMKSDNAKTGENIEKKEGIKLSPKVIRFIETIYDPQLYQSTAGSFNVDTRKLPLGSLGLMQIEKASNIIKKISQLIAQKQSKETIDQIAELSSLFYTTVPSAEAKLKPIDTVEKVSDKSDLLDFLRNTCYMGQNINKDIGAKYLRLDTHLSHVTDSSVTSMIKTYLRTNAGATHNVKLDIVGIYEINKPKEKQAYRKWDSLHNKQLLWHGTRMANAVGILTTGLRINPVGVPTTGKMFGNGLYFANSSTKSAGYLGTHRGLGILFLCEVALGNMYERLYAEHIAQLPPGKHSTKGLGLDQPDTETHVVIDGDVTVPIGRLLRGGNSGRLQYDEFIVYDVTQIRMRYAVLVDLK